MGTYESIRAGRGEGIVRRVVEGRKNVGGNMDGIQMIDSLKSDQTSAKGVNVTPNAVLDKNV
jgi:hypothetical protein